jgi:hypothetical protein
LFEKGSPSFLAEGGNRFTADMKEALAQVDSCVVNAIGARHRLPERLLLAGMEPVDEGTQNSAKRGESAHPGSGLGPGR